MLPGQVRDSRVRPCRDPSSESRTCSGSPRSLYACPDKSGTPEYGFVMTHRSPELVRGACAPCKLARTSPGLRNTALSGPIVGLPNLFGEPALPVCLPGQVRDSRVRPCRDSSESRTCSGSPRSLYACPDKSGTPEHGPVGTHRSPELVRGARAPCMPARTSPGLQSTALSRLIGVPNLFGEPALPVCLPGQVRDSGTRPWHDSSESRTCSGSLRPL